MVGTLPEAGTVVGGVGLSLFICAPVPFTFGSEPVAFDVFPAALGLVQGLLVAEVAIEVDVAHDRLALHPSLPLCVGFQHLVVGRGISCHVHPSFVNHAAVRLQSVVGYVGY